jgi:outer membrane protein assembly factor BamB
MFCRLATLLSILVLSLTGASVQAQTPLPRDLLPTRTALARLGLEKQWSIVVPLVGTERLLRISRSHDLLFAQTDQAVLHTYDAQTGGLLWTTTLGQNAPYARPVSSNSFGVFLTIANYLYALDRGTGRVIWKHNLDTIPTSGTACDEDRVMVGLTTGKLLAFSLKEKKPMGPDQIRSKPVLLLNWQSTGPVTSMPLSAERLLVFGGSDGRVYVSLSSEQTALYRIATGGPIGRGLGAFGTRTLLIPSADQNLYAIDLMTSKVLWTFPSGAPIDQPPLIAGEDIYVINERGDLSLLDPNSGSPRWTTPTADAQFVSVSAGKIYLRTVNNDLLIIDRATGKPIADAPATLQRAGLNLREYDLSFLNRFDDRLYFGTHSGLVICLREIGQVEPMLLRDPKALPFGYIPPEGIKQTPPAPQPAAAEAAAPAAADKPEAGAAPAAEDKPEDKPETKPEDKKPEGEALR